MPDKTDELDLKYHMNMAHLRVERLRKQLKAAEIDLENRVNDYARAVARNDAATKAGVTQPVPPS